MAMKEKALAKATSSRTRNGRYRSAAYSFFFEEPLTGRQFRLGGKRGDRKPGRKLGRLLVQLPGVGFHDV
jgi:hypothetical protein